VDARACHPPPPSRLNPQRQSSNHSRLARASDPSCHTSCHPGVRRARCETRLTCHPYLSGALVSQPAVSKHLGILKQAGLVRDRHEGRQTHYSAQFGALAPLIDWTSQMAGFWQGRFDQLEDLLKRMDQ